MGCKISNKLHDEETEEKSALFIVDMQNDFCTGTPEKGWADGNLAVGASLDIIPIINELRENKKFDYVVTSRDWHPPDHCSFATNNGKTAFTQQIIEETGREQVMWPDHCVRDTFGAEFHPDMVINHDTDIQVLKGTFRLVETYSGFGSIELGEDTGMVERFKKLGVRHVYCVGLAFDYCVGSTAIDAVKYGFNTYIIKDATKAVAPPSEATMQERLDKAGVKVMHVADL